MYGAVKLSNPLYNMELICHQLNDLSVNLFCRISQLEKAQNKLEGGIWTIKPLPSVLVHWHRGVVLLQLSRQCCWWRLFISSIWRQCLTKRKLSTVTELLKSRLSFNLMASVCIFILYRKWSPEAWKPSCSSDVMLSQAFTAAVCSCFWSLSSSVMKCSSIRLKVNISLTYHQKLKWKHLRRIAQKLNSEWSGKRVYLPLDLFCRLHVSATVDI